MPLNHEKDPKVFPVEGKISLNHLISSWMMMNSKSGNSWKIQIIFPKHL